MGWTVPDVRSVRPGTLAGCSAFGCTTVAGCGGKAFGCIAVAGCGDKAFGCIAVAGCGGKAIGCASVAGCGGRDGEPSWFSRSQGEGFIVPAACSRRRDDVA